MPQAVFNLGDVLAPVEQIHGPGVTERVHGVDVLQSFWGQGFREVFFADTVYAMPGEFLSALTDKETVLIEGFWCCSIPVDIEIEELRGLFLKSYEPETICFSEDGHSFLLGVEVVEIECCDLRGPGA